MFAPVLDAVAQSRALRAVVGNSLFVAECLRAVCASDGGGHVARWRPFDAAAAAALEASDRDAVLAAVDGVLDANRSVLAGRAPPAMEVVTAILCYDALRLRAAGIPDVGGHLTTVGPLPSRQLNVATLEVAPAALRQLLLRGARQSSLAELAGLDRAIFSPTAPLWHAGVQASVTLLLDAYVAFAKVDRVPLAFAFRLMALATQLPGLDSRPLGANIESLVGRLMNFFCAEATSSRVVNETPRLYSTCTRPPAQCTCTERLSYVHVHCALVELSGASFPEGAFRIFALGETQHFMGWVLSACAAYQTPLAAVLAAYGPLAFGPEPARELLAALVDKTTLATARAALPAAVDEAERRFISDSVAFVVRASREWQYTKDRLPGFIRDALTKLCHAPSAIDAGVASLPPAARLAAALPLFASRPAVAALFHALLAMCDANSVLVCEPGWSGALAPAVRQLQEAIVTHVCAPLAAIVRGYGDGSLPASACVPALCGVHRLLAGVWALASAARSHADEEARCVVLACLVRIDRALLEAGVDLAAVLDACERAAASAGTAPPPGLRQLRARHALLTLTSAAVGGEALERVFVRATRLVRDSHGALPPPTAAIASSAPGGGAVTLVTLDELQRATRAAASLTPSHAPAFKLVAHEDAHVMAAIRAGMNFELAVASCSAGGSGLRCGATTLALGAVLARLVDAPRSLFHAARGGRVDACKLLVQLGRPLHARDMIAAAALACVSQHADLVAWACSWLQQHALPSSASLSRSDAFAEHARATQIGRAHV